jgi:hypothetical protein
VCWGSASGSSGLLPGVYCRRTALWIWNPGGRFCRGRQSLLISGPPSSAHRTRVKVRVAGCAAGTGTAQRVCGLMSISVSSFRYRSQRSDQDLMEELARLAREKPRAMATGGCRC